MKNLAYFIEFSNKKNYSFFIDEVNPIITNYLNYREANDFTNATRQLGLITETLLKDIYRSFIDPEEDPAFSSLIFQIKNLDSLNVKLTPPIETLLRFTINLRNISSHKTNDNLRDFIMIADEIRIEECVVAEKMMIKIIKWFLANKGFDISSIPNYTYLVDQDTVTKNLVIPNLFKDNKNFQSVIIPENAEIHVHSMIIDYLIRGFNLEEISNKYFNNSNDEGKISYRIICGQVGLNKQWQELFKKNNYKDIVNLLKPEKHRIIIEALKLHISKSN